jgi:hypothetical protein
MSGSEVFNILTIRCISIGTKWFLTENVVTGVAHAILYFNYLINLLFLR